MEKTEKKPMKLVKRFENDTDFDVCVFKDDRHHYITIYDCVSQKHTLKKKYTTVNEKNVLADAEELNNSYKI